MPSSLLSLFRMGKHRLCIKTGIRFVILNIGVILENSGLKVPQLVRLWDLGYDFKRCVFRYMIFTKGSGRSYRQKAQVGHTDTKGLTFGTGNKNCGYSSIQSTFAVRKQRPSLISSFKINCVLGITQRASKFNRYK